MLILHIIKIVLSDIMIGSNSILNAIALPVYSYKYEYYFTDIISLLYTGVSDTKYTLDNYDIFSFCGEKSKICVAYAWSKWYSFDDSFFNSFILSHNGKMVKVNFFPIVKSPLEHSEGKFVNINMEKYLEAKYRFITGDEIYCLHDIKENIMRFKLLCSYLKGIKIKDFYIDAKTIYYFITFLDEVYSNLLGCFDDSMLNYYKNNPKEYNLEEYYKDKLGEKFKDFESLLDYIKEESYTLRYAYALGNGVLYIRIISRRLYEIYVVNQNGNIYMASKLIGYPKVNVFYNVLNKTAKVIVYDPPLEYFGDYILSDKGLLVTYVNSKGERLIFDPNSLELVPIDCKDAMKVCFSYEKEFDTSICIRLFWELLEHFGSIYNEILIPKNIIYAHGIDNWLVSSNDEFGYIYDSSLKVEVYFNKPEQVNKIFKYTLWGK